MPLQDDSEKLFILKDVIDENNILATNLHDGVSDDFIAKFSSLGIIIAYKKNEVILREGEFNQKLFFLISGEVKIIVEDEVVASMNKRGGVIGEIGLITKLPSTATVLATDDTKLLVFDYPTLTSIKSEQSLNFLYILYQLFAKILSQKLIETNHKAKQFERINKQLEIAKQELENTNLDLETKIEERTDDLKKKAEELSRSHYLLENQNSALLASNRKLEDLYNNRKSTLAKLEQLYNIHLKKLKESISSSDLQNITHEVNNVMEQLRPISELYLSENSMQGKKLLAFENSKKQQTAIKLALGGTGMGLTFVNTSEEAMAALSGSNFDFMLISTDNMDFAPYAYEKAPQMKQLLMTADPIPTYLERLKKFRFINNVVSKNDDHNFSIKSTAISLSKISGRDIFGLEHYLSWGVEVKSKTVNHSKMRKTLIAEMQQHFSELGVRTTIVERCQFVAEELLMNIVYDAPVDASGKALYNHLPRTVPVQLPPNEAGIFRYATDGVLVAVSTQDPFGALSKEIILNYLDSCYHGITNSLATNKGGAGKGLYQIIEVADVVIFNVIPHQKTEVIAIFNIDMKAAKKINTPSFHLFYA